MALWSRPLDNSRMTAIDIELPQGCAVEAGPPGDHPLLPEEAFALKHAIPKRRRQFAGGRHYARLAMRRLAGVAAPIPRDERGRPVWPPGFIGSISHSEVLAAAAVSNGPLRGIGIDVEDAHRLTHGNPRLYRKLFTADERARMGTDPREGALLFSAKEAAYKAVNPLVGQYIGYREVEADIDWDFSTIRIRYLGDHAPNRLLDQGYGRFRFCDDQVVTLFFIE